MAVQQEIFVFANWETMTEPKLMGVLSAERIRGKEVFSFEYNSTWLSSEFAQVLDPDLQLFSGSQYLYDQNKFNFGLFLDSSPDRWGRVLMQRREAAYARLENRGVNKLFEMDYLLGVYDGHRMGALRFKNELNGSFLNDDKNLASPPWTSLPELEQISLKLEDEDSMDAPQYLKWLNMLINPGSSLGGARPKASILDSKNHLWIAKFPSKLDYQDIGAWEMVAYTLALEAGIKMAQCQIKRLSSYHHTFLTKRFDRTPKGKRIHFSSAMTQLGYADGINASDGASYLELVDFIIRNGANVKEDLQQLWRRIVFSICISNTDDHLRNHGFLLSENGWNLSPAYDINPNETGKGLKLNISEVDNALDLELAMDVHEFFRLDKSTAHTIINQVTNAVGKWRKVASYYGISKVNQEIKAAAFE